MKTISKKFMSFTAITTVCFGLFGFVSKYGGEGFEIYLNNKLVMQQFGKQLASVNSLQLDQRFSNEQLTVKYYHCGQVGKNRHITIRDNQNKVLKDWRFNDGSNNAAMNCPVNEILSLQKRNSNSVNLYYSSAELPNGRLLTSIVLAADNKSKISTR